MTQSLLIAGLGTMGQHYARNARHLKDSFGFESIIGADVNAARCREMQERFRDMKIYHVEAKSDFVLPSPYGLGQTPDMASMINTHQCTGFIGATQTDSHLTVLRDALSACSDNGAPIITSVLQEKPFGLFENNTEKNDALDRQITTHDIRFNLNSILMFSEIWDLADAYLDDNPGLKRLKSVCIYGKDRTRDDRPAHEGVFGTEGTHAVDILQGRGQLARPLNIAGSFVTQGPIGRETSTPYYCKAHGSLGGGTIPFNLEMSLAFDRAYRMVDHYFEGDNGKQITMRLAFDVNGMDHFTVWDRNNGKTLNKAKTDAKAKLANSMRASFGTHSNTIHPVNGIDKTRKLRRTLAVLKDADAVSVKKSPPTPSRPTL